MIEVYRVEHKVTGVGPFQTNSEFCQKLVKNTQPVLYRLKNPHDDGLEIAYIPYTYVFGCPDINSMKQWILTGRCYDENYEIINTLDEMGFVLSNYLVHPADVRMSWSKIQLAFCPIDAKEEKLVSHLSIKELIKESPLVFCMN